jgi:hypothetical protein
MEFVFAARKLPERKIIEAGNKDSQKIVAEGLIMILLKLIY